MGKGKELEFPEGWGGGKGEPGVPPKLCAYAFFSSFKTQDYTHPALFPSQSS
jgi:hypothetical protein